MLGNLGKRKPKPLRDKLIGHLDRQISRRVAENQHELEFGTVRNHPEHRVPDDFGGEPDFGVEAALDDVVELADRVEFACQRDVR